MSHEPNSEHDELRLAAMLRSIETDVAAPDPQVLKELRRRSVDVFAGGLTSGAELSRQDAMPGTAASPHLQAVAKTEIDSPKDANTISTTKMTTNSMDLGVRREEAAARNSRRNTMFTLVGRTALMASMTVLFLVTWFASTGPTPVVAGTLPFSKILEELRGASTLELKLLKGDQESQILVRAPGLVRKEESPTRYQIAAGSRLWKIDEVANTVEEGDSPWFLKPSSQIDLLELLDLGVTDASALLRARPVDQAMFPHRMSDIKKQVIDDGSPARSKSQIASQANCLVYRVELPTEKQRVQVEAYVNADDHRLVGIVAWPEGTRRNAGPPLAEMRLIAMNNDVSDGKFKVANSLTEDGRIGTLSQAQGIVVLRPMLARRWSPVGSQAMLKPGDWLRTELRGANAAKMTLSSEVELTLGPGTLVECVSPQKVRVHYGIVQVSTEKIAADVEKANNVNGNTSPLEQREQLKKTDEEFVLLAPREGSRVFKTGEKRLIRVDRDEHLVDVPQTPVWLAGFEGTSSNESIGSLIVNLPDGRNEPLTVGYHKVSVEIRDQIARTTIEESFVNRTKSRLEGVFHFPLPQDASISGFGMWIGNDLVEADIVEKQRAREIYETILRERRDPGLLEWTAGNLFKARVFPIEPLSEKRIKIVYTQVLPLRGNRYRYSYGLRSDLLRANPLRELSMSVTVNSALGLKSISCPTHSARTQQNAHSGQIEFSAQEYTPTRDFEVVCEIDQQQSDVVMVPHRRGEDGYFLIQIIPPFPRDPAASTGGGRLNELVPDGNPLNVVLLCDTSASMDSEKRSKQSEFVTTVLSSLGPDDRFQVAACDVGTVWSSDVPLAPTPENIAKSLGFLSDRVSLGWTNLDRAFDDVLKRAARGAQVVYIGDGIVSSGDTDPAAFVKRLAKRFDNPAATDRTAQGKESAVPTPMTFHAVTVGNTYESVILKGIASIGRGSMRTIGGEQSPQLVARELLNEIAEPGLTDLNVEIRGIRVAAVYPGQLPNLAAGTQQILVGRYLPEPGTKDQQGEVIVTGWRGTERVKFVGRVSMKNAEDGNSFIPRLWARAHLDHLLAQGQSSVIQDEIIQLSEEFHIITPYTSLLVLESDADRDRFGVKRRYEIRDGERFFAEGRENANFDLRQQQMKQAELWRLGLQKQILQSLSNLGRDPQKLNPFVHILDSTRYATALGGGGGMRGGAWSPMSGPSGSVEFGGFDGRMKYRISDFEDARMPGGVEFDAWAETDLKLGKSVLRTLGEDKSGPFDSSDLSPMEPMSFGLTDGTSETRQELSFKSNVANGLWDSAPSSESVREKDSLRGLSFGVFGRKSESSDWFFDSLPELSNGRDEFLGRKNKLAGIGSHFASQTPDYTSWINVIFPTLEPRPTARLPVKKDPDAWSPAAVDLARSLLRTESLSKLDGGIELRRDVTSMDPRWNRSMGCRVDLAMYSPRGWLTRGLNPDEQTLVNFCDGTERGVYSLAFLLGRTRPSVASELQSPPLGLSDFSLSSVAQTYAMYSARVETDGDDRAILILTSKDSESEVRMTIDTKRHVLLKTIHSNAGKQVSSMSYEDFLEVAGTWWATKVVVRDDQERVTSETRLNVSALTADQYDQRMKAELTAKSSVQFLHFPFESVRIARQKVADGSAGFNDRFLMILSNAQRQQWDEMWKHVDFAEKLTADKPGIRWMRTILLTTIRRNEQALQRLTDEARRLAPAAVQDDFYLAEFLLGQINSLTSVNELYKIHELLKPVYTRPFSDRIPSGQGLQAADIDARTIAEIQRGIFQNWIGREFSCMESMGRMEEALVLRREAAESIYWDSYLQEAYAQRLVAAGRIGDAHDWLRKVLTRPEWNAGEVDSLRSAVAELYRQQGQWAELLNWTTEWIARNPDSTSYNSAYSQHLAALIYNNQLDAAYAVADRWLREACVEGRMTPVQRARLEAALNFANGNLYQINFQRIEERWFEPLAAAARFFARHPHHFDITQRCVSNHYFSQSDISDQLRGEWFLMLRRELPSMTATQIGTLIGWTLSGRLELAEPIDGRKQLDGSEVPNEIWLAIANGVKARWLASQNPDERWTLSEALRTIYANRFAETELLPFLRERITTVDPAHKQQSISSLFESLVPFKWTNEIEQEAFATWRLLAEKKDPRNWLSVELPTLLRLVDAMLANRIAAAERTLNDQGDLDKLTRKELAAKRAESKKAAREGLSARLALEAAKEEQTAAGEQSPEKELSLTLASWLQIEQAWLDVQNEQKLSDVEAFCWTILGDSPPGGNQKVEADASPDDLEEDSVARQVQESKRFYDSLLRQRAFVTVSYLATRKQAAPSSIERLLKYVDSGIASEAGNKDDEPSATQESQLFWRRMKFRLLVALDRPQLLEKELRDWIRTDVSTAPWRLYLARLVAEQGKLDEAIQLFEACERDKLLSAADYPLLAHWSLALNRRDAYNRYRIEAYMQMPEGNLAQMIYRAQNRWQQTNIPLPSELDENTLFVFRALFKKSAQPENYLWQLRNLYAASRDFRLLQMLPDSILGRSPQQVYAFIASLEAQVLYELRNEATADEILARIKSLRTGELTATDLRALDLMEAFIERKSSEVLNQPGPHVDACLAALQRAFQREWSDGEPRLMSQFLANCGGFSNETLRAEQIREIRELQKRVPAGSRDHLAITSNLCHVLFWNYSRHDEALREMEAEVQAYLQINHGIWPHEDNDTLGRYVQMQEGANHHAAGESVLKTQLSHPANDEQRKWLNDRLMSLYNHALEHDGAVSIGTGRANLLSPIVELTLRELESAPDENVRYNLVSRLTTTFDIANRHKLPGTVESVRKFAFETIPAVLRRQTSQYRNTASVVTHMISTILSKHETLKYVIERMEQWPQRLEIQYENSWNMFGSELAARREAAGTTDLDSRVLKLAVARLQRELRQGEGGHQAIFHIGYSGFWKEKTTDFAEAAEQILNERRAAGRRAVVVANYLRNGLHLFPRSIEILLIADRKGLLEESAQFQLVSWLHQENRFAEMIPILDRLVTAHPDNIHYRTELMIAYARSQRPEQLKELIESTHEDFHQGGRWTEANIAQFARGCQGASQWDRMQAYFTEAIALHQRSNPGSGLNDGTLSDYYQQLARAESSLNHTEAAVTAASAAIVCWDAGHQQRQYSLNTLREILNASTNLPAYVEHLDAESLKSGQDSPILRKAIGDIYRNRGAFDDAIAQYKLAIELQPNDKEVHQALIACYDATNNHAAATAQLLKLIDVQRHDLTLYQQLAERMKDNEAESERAATSIVESAPNESESHAALAELRQKQGRWDEAIPHWEQVAKLRKLEPTGLLKLAEAQLHEKQWDHARKSLNQLSKTEWPSRFNNVNNEVRQLEQRLPTP